MKATILSRKLLPLLRCPLTGSELKLTGGADMLQAADTYQGHTVTYALHQGIPVLLPGHATLTKAS